MIKNIFNKQTKKSLVSKAGERDFERECTKMQNLEESSKKIHKDAKKVSSSITEYGKASLKLGQDVTASLGEKDSKNLQPFETAMFSNEQLLQEKSAMLHQSVVEPMKKYSTIFPNYAAHIKSREKALDLYTKAQIKLEKHEKSEHTGSIMVKIDMARKDLEPVKKDFDAKHEKLMKEMPLFYDDRLNYIQPSLEAMIHAQCWSYKESIKSLQNCLDEMKIEVGDKADLDVRNTLEEIRNLSITEDD